MKNKTKTSLKRYLFMARFLSWKVKLIGSVFFIMLFLSTYFLPNIQNKWLAKPEKAFFIEDLKISYALKHFMIREQGLYTLMGSKPMTLFLFQGLPLTPEEKKEVYQELPSAIQKQFSYHDLEFIFNDEKLWDYLENRLERQKKTNFIFCKRGDFGFFVNVAETAWILHKYYDDFFAVTKKDFDPIEAVYEISDPTSDFWNVIDTPFSHHYLWGLLFGYGEKNAYLFEKMVSKKIVDRGLFNRQMKKNHSSFKVDLGVEDLTVPDFRTFSSIDDAVNKYNEEREIIIDLLRGKDFKKEVLFHLYKRPTSSAFFLMHAVSGTDAPYLNYKRSFKDAFEEVDIVDIVIVSESNDLKNAVFQKFTECARKQGLQIIGRDEFLRDNKHSDQWEKDAYYTLTISKGNEEGVGVISEALDAYADVRKDRRESLVTLWHRSQPFHYQETHFFESAIEASRSMIDQFIQHIAYKKDDKNAPKLLIVFETPPVSY